MRRVIAMPFQLVAALAFTIASFQTLLALYGLWTGSAFMDVVQGWIVNMVVLNLVGITTGIIALKLRSEL